MFISFYSQFVVFEIDKKQILKQKLSEVKKIEFLDGKIPKRRECRGIQFPATIIFCDWEKRAPWYSIVAKCSIIKRRNSNA
jgi:hypothetical protein